uniref:Cytochrome P450 n=1 Tax=Eptatretus burgeri TaxID=7764 RepID=A0A8C4QYI1_EPTBU
MLSGLLQLTSENSFQELMITFPLEWLLVVLLILAPVAWWYRKVYGASSVRSLPPGPVCLPLLGSAPWLLLGGRGFAPHLRLAQLADRYGDVMTLVVGSKLVVVVSGAAAIREALGIGGDALAGRPPLPLPLLLNHGKARVQAEIDREVEQTRLPNVRDRSHLHYTEATLREVMRCSAVVPLALPHFTLCEISLHGYTIPVNTTVLVNLWSAHHDPRVWRRPTEFDPSRFLDAQEELLWPAAFMPFGIGRRACPGAQIARAELFVLFSSILQAFTLIPASSPSLGNLQGHFGLTLAPPQFKLHLHPRR